MGLTSIGTFNSSLAEYCKTILLDNWQKQRSDVEIKWKKNEDAFNSIATGETWKKEEGSDWRSNTFISITKIKVVTAYSMVIDMLLQGGQLPFSLVLSPWDEVVMEDLPQEQQRVLQDSIDDMQSLIHQQILECNGDRELMKCVMSAVKLGETYWKTYIHKVTRRGFGVRDLTPPREADPEFDYRVFDKTENKVETMGFNYVSCWDIFRDMETDDMQKSRGYCERSWTSPYELRKLMTKYNKESTAPYIDDAINKVVKEHGGSTGTKTNKDTTTPRRRKTKDPYNSYQQWEFWCRVPRKIVKEFEKNKGGKGLSSIPEIENDGDEVEVGVTMVEEEVIRLVKIREDSRPHGRVVWEINPDDNFGIGVGDNVAPVQKSLVGAVRAFEDNKTLSANVMLAIKKNYIQDWSGEFKPGEAIEISDDCDDARKAIQQLIIQDVGQSLLEVIALFERFGDDLSMIPRIQQGSVAPKQKPDTLGEINILQSNSGKYFGSGIKNFDEGMIEPIISRLYEYNMLDENVKKGRGNYNAKAQGFSSYNNKIIRLEKLLRALNLVMSAPAIERETSLKSLLTDVFKALDIDPDTAFKTDEEKQQYDQAMQAAQQAAGDQKGMEILAKVKAEMEKSLAEIEAKHKAKLIEMEAEHQDKLAEMGAEWDEKVSGEKKEAA